NNEQRTTNNELYKKINPFRMINACLYWGAHMENRDISIIRKEVQFLNKHLAKERRSLEDLLKEDKPRIILRDGSRHLFKKAELEKLARILPEGEHSNLRLPIYIELSPDRFGSGTARITGKVDCQLIAKIIDLKYEKDEIFIYRPDIRKLRRELPTTTQYMFTIGVEI
ncbi:MAG: DUF61 family protein, partial [Candidatus Hydrothermarchaeales archaeon]